MCTIILLDLSWLTCMIILLELSWMTCTIILQELLWLICTNTLTQRVVVANYIFWYHARYSFHGITEDTLFIHRGDHAHKAASLFLHNSALLLLSPVISPDLTDSPYIHSYTRSSSRSIGRGMVMSSLSYDPLSDENTGLATSNHPQQ